MIISTSTSTSTPKTLTRRTIRSNNVFSTSTCLLAASSSSTNTGTGRRGSRSSRASSPSSSALTNTNTNKVTKRRRSRHHQHHHRGARSPQPEFLEFNAKLKRLISKKDVTAAEDLLLKSLQKYEDGSGTLRPDKFHFGIVINGWARSNNPSKAEDLLRRIEDYYYEDGKTWLKPVVVQYSSVIHALARSTHRYGNHAAQKAEDMLRHMERMYFEAGNVDVRPDKITYTTVITAWAKAAARGSDANGSNVHAAMRAEAVLQRMLHLYNTDKKNFEDVKPDVIAYTSVITAWCNCGKVDKAEQMLEEMEAQYMLYSYQAARRSKDDNADIDIDADIVAVRPNVATYTAIMDGYRSEKSEEVFHKMVERGIQPDVASYTAVLHGLAHSTCTGNMTPTPTPTPTQRAEALLQQMELLNGKVKPTTATYNAMMDVWAKHGNNVSRAEAVLRRMQHLYTSGENTEARPNALSYSSLINAYAKSKHRNAALQAEKIFKEQEQDSNIRPVTQTYDALIDAWARSNAHTPDSAERAEAWFHKMVQRYQDGDRAVRPSVRSCNKVLLAWSRSSRVDAPQAAEAFLNQLYINDVVKPDIVSYTTVIKAWASSSDPQAGSKADALLTRAIEKYRAGDASMKPDVVTYNCFLKALANCSRVHHNRDDYDVEAACRQADEILVGMILLSRIGDVLVRPNRITYEHMIDVWSKSDSVKAFGKIESYRQMAIAAGHDDND
eukprot:CAMPEP_0116033140 /NCGR_PEP_ID=MMETSP0321-20121206/18760_1 /TAXON_ID=163516 /ORGANISM="Leptocylindrus danicus var. danicus, Strain B650" /LENGTH=724 /DNA_ID=CAMNT_0003509055 /DNA_START=118 /DNA_END=2292 /DNA_ORIENTATION=+